MADLAESPGLLERLAAEHGTPFFVYDLDAISARIGSLREAFGGRFGISYAVKSNPNPGLLAGLRGLADTLDVSSGGELARALDLGWEPERISFTGPAKRDRELRLAAERSVGEVVLESVDEAVRLDGMAAIAGRRQPVLIRVAPLKIPRGFGVRMAGKPSQFGIDEEELVEAGRAIGRLPHLDLRGFHVYSGTQCLDAGAVVENYRIFIDIFRRGAEALGLRPGRLIFGSGLGIPYHDDESPLDLAAVARGIAPDLDALRREERFADAALALETGRYLVGEAGLYVTGVVNLKRSRGAEIAICDGGMNHHLGACGHLGSVIHRNYRMFRVGAAGAEATGTYDLVGPLCTSIDMLGHGVRLPRLAPGDLIAIRSSGAYGLTASPVHFISHPPPRELIVQRDGEGGWRVEDVTHILA